MCADEVSLESYDAVANGKALDIRMCVEELGVEGGNEVAYRFPVLESIAGFDRGP